MKGYMRRKLCFDIQLITFSFLTVNLQIALYVSLQPAEQVVIRTNRESTRLDPEIS